MVILKPYAIVFFVEVISVSSYFNEPRTNEHDHKNTYSTLFELKLALAALSQSDKSMVTMPLTVRLSLCKLMDYGSGPAKEQLSTLITSNKQYKSCSGQVPKILKQLNTYPIILINKMYVNDKYDLNPKFFTETVAKYGVHVQKLAFSRPRTSTMYVNNWFEQVSLRRLRNLLTKEEINERTSILLASAAHLQTTWAIRFDLRKTKQMTFITINHKERNVPMMTKIEDSLLYYYDTTHKFKILSIPLVTQGMWFTILLTDDPYGFSQTMTTIFRDPMILQNARKKMVIASANVTIPKFKIKNTFSMDGALWQVGLKRIYDKNDTGLVGMLKHVKNGQAYLSLTKQQVFLDVDEMGALKSGIVEFDDYHKKMAEKFERDIPLLGSKFPQFLVDHPFMFSVDVEVHYSGEQVALLVGAYYGPEEPAREK